MKVAHGEAVNYYQDVANLGPFPVTALQETGTPNGAWASPSFASSTSAASPGGPVGPGGVVAGAAANKAAAAVAAAMSIASPSVASSTSAVIDSPLVGVGGGDLSLSGSGTCPRDDRPAPPSLSVTCRLWIDQEGMMVEGAWGVYVGRLKRSSPFAPPFNQCFRYVGRDKKYGDVYENLFDGRRYYMQK